MLQARSVAECHLYMSLHPCDCGEDDFPWARHELGDIPGGAFSAYSGTCPTCGRSRRFEFALVSDPPPPDFGGEQPSTIIDPGDFLETARSAHDAALAGGWDAERAEDAEFAVAALAEVLKFIPPHGDRVPASAFTSAAGLKLVASDPAQFERTRLEALLGDYRRLRDAIAPPEG